MYILKEILEISIDYNLWTLNLKSNNFQIN